MLIFSKYLDKSASSTYNKSPRHVIDVAGTLYFRIGELNREGVSRIYLVYVAAPDYSVIPLTDISLITPQIPLGQKGLPQPGHHR